MLLGSLCDLRDQGNTVIVVEHDEDTMRAADHIVDFGPGPGVRGGEVVVEGLVRRRHKVETQPDRAIPLREEADRDPAATP